MSGKVSEEAYQRAMMEAIKGKDLAIAYEKKEKERIQAEFEERDSRRAIDDHLLTVFLDNNGNPEARAAFLRDINGEIAFGTLDADTIVALKPNGQPAIDSDGNRVTLEQAVKEHLRANPFLANVTSTRDTTPAIRRKNAPLDDREKMEEFNRLVKEGVRSDEAWKRAGLPT